ncbi:MAG: DUF4080 domain-containing protein [Clostridia bacterium]|nr:DUF4080 domain-containing protein [Clostridia bacterium]
MKIKLIAINSKFIHTNTAVWYLHYSLEKYNMNSEVMTFTVNDDYDEVLRGIIKDLPDIVCFSCYIWNIERIYELIEDIRKVSPGTKIVLGGPEVSFDCESVLRKTEADLIIRGEGELVISPVLSGDRSFGCAYLENGKYIDRGHAVVDDLNEIPFIFTEEMLEKEKNRIIYYESSRGCPYHCIYCLSSTLTGVRYLDTDRVLKELLMLSKSGVRQIKFVDRTFNLNNERTLGILNFIKNLDTNINFHLEIYPAALSEKIMTCLGEIKAGRVQIEAGIQSTNQKVLDYSKRNQNPALALSNSKLIIEKGNIHVHLDLLAGLPYEDKHSFINSFNETIKVRPHVLQLGFLKLLKGTHARNEKGYTARNKAPYEILETPWLSFIELGEIKKVEQVLEIYYNSGKFIRTMSYMLDHSKSSYHSFLSLAQAIGETGNVNETDRYKALYDFLGKDKIKEYLRFDYMATHSSKSIPEFLKNEYDSKEQSFAYFKKEKKEAREWVKHTNISTFHMEETTTWLFDYRKKDSVTGTFTFERIEL